MNPFNMKWMVTIQKGQYMAGVHRFETKKKATEFVDRWVHAELMHPGCDSDAETIRTLTKIERQRQL